MATVSQKKKRVQPTGGRTQGDAAGAWGKVTDRELIRLGKDRDQFQSAMIALWERYKKRLYFYAKYKLNFNRPAENPQEKYIIEDIIQNVFCDVLMNLTEYRPQFEVSTWIYTITNKHIVRYIRETQKYHGRTTGIEDATEHAYFSSESAKPDAEYELKEFERIIVLFVQSLKRSLDRDVFILYLQNLHTKNIAELIKTTQDATRARLNRVIKKFKRFLKRHYPEYLNSVTLSQIKNLNITMKKSTPKSTMPEGA